jgi:hypothetical protein
MFPGLVIVIDNIQYIVTELHGTLGYVCVTRTDQQIANLMLKVGGVVGTDYTGTTVSQQVYSVSYI